MKRVKNSIIRAVIVYALTFKGSKQLTYSHNAVLFNIYKHISLKLLPKFGDSPKIFHAKSFR